MIGFFGRIGISRPISPFFMTCVYTDVRTVRPDRRHQKEENTMAIGIVFGLGLVAIIGVGAYTNEDFWDF